MKSSIALAALALFATNTFATSTSIVIGPGDTITISAPAATVGGGGPIVTPPVPTPSTGGWDGKCGSVPTTVLNLDWANPQQLYSVRAGGFAPDGYVVVVFTTGARSSQYSLAALKAAEYNSPPSPRVGVLSDKPCDFDTRLAMYAYNEGNSITAQFGVGTGYTYNYYPALKLNTTYYLNLKNSPNSTCAQNNACDIFVDLRKVDGI